MRKRPAYRPGWAVLIGIDEYEDGTSFPPLRCCVRDALALYVLLTQPEFGGLNPVCVSLVADIDDGPLRDAVEEVAAGLAKRHRFTPRPGVAAEVMFKRVLPSRAAILAAVTLAADYAAREELLFVSASCHGFVFDGAVYLACPETRVGVPGETAVPLEWVKERLGKSKALLRALILDTCRSGAAAGTTAPPSREQLRSALLNAPEEVAVLASCQPWEPSYELAKHGLFSACVLRGLALKARGRGGGVSLRDLYDYAAPRVKRWVARNQGQGPVQTPCLHGRTADQIVLSGRRRRGIPMKRMPPPRAPHARPAETAPTPWWAFLLAAACLAVLLAAVALLARPAPPGPAAPLAGSSLPSPAAPDLPPAPPQPAAGGGRVEGILTDPEGRPIADMRIGVRDGPETASDSRGRFVLGGVPAGDKLIVVRPPSEKGEWTQTVVVRPRGTTPVRIIYDPGLARLALLNVAAPVDGGTLEVRRQAGQHRAAVYGRCDGLGQVLRGGDIWVVLRSEIDGHFWVQHPPAMVDWSAGEWRADVLLGNPRNPPRAGERWHLVAVAAGPGSTIRRIASVPSLSALPRHIPSNVATVELDIR